MKRSLIFSSLVLLVLVFSFEPSRPGQEERKVEMKVASVRVDPIEGRSVVVLEDTDKKKAIPIWIGVHEANAIYLETHGIVPPRPMTHDLIKNILEGLHVQVEHILIHDVRQNVIYARIILKRKGKTVTIDARPSDAIALAVRVKAPIFVTEEIYQKLSIDLKSDERGGPELNV